MQVAASVPKPASSTKRGDEPRRARMRRHDMAEAARDDVTCSPTALGDLGRVRGRRDGIEAARQQQHRHVALDGLGEIGRIASFRPLVAHGERSARERAHAFIVDAIDALLRG